MKYHVVMVRVGNLYGPKYVDTLSDMLARNLSELDDVTPWCITDDPDSLPEDVQAIPADPNFPGWWQKVRLFSADMPWEEGDRILYVDLDSVVTGRLEELIQTKGIIKDWHVDSFNSSVMVWDHGEHRQIYENLTEIPPNMGDQDWITQQAPDFPILPEAWCVSYRKDAREEPPEGALVVCMHGEPKPAEIVWGWVPDFWKIGGYHQLPRTGMVNVEADFIIANIKDAIKRDLPWFSGAGPHKETAVIVCGGPSLARSIPAIKAHKQRGAIIITVNNTMRYLMERGIKPDAHVMLDARQENAQFLDVKEKGGKTPPDVRYLIASQCHPDVFDALKERWTVVWHNIAPGLEEVFAPYINGPKPMLLVPGGGTVGLRAISLAWMSGYSKIHVYGMDGSYEGDKHHAYPQALNDVNNPVEVQLGHEGKRYRSTRWMVRQASEAKDAIQKLEAHNIRLSFHGNGLIPDMAKALKAQKMEAKDGTVR